MRQISLTLLSLALSTPVGAQAPVAPSPAPTEETPAAPAAATPPESPVEDAAAASTSASAEVAPAAATAPPTQTPPAPTEASAAVAASTPSIELDLAPSPDAHAQSGELRTDAALYGLRGERLRGAGTTVGGYGELHYNLDRVTGPGETAAEIDLHRLVLFVAHRFDERLRFYSEIEVEHAVASSEAGGEVAVEQAYVDYLLYEQSVGLRAGVLLIPMGIVNQWHEPPIFHGVERPSVDRVIIPSTWSEAGIGLFGEPVEGFRYELYVVSGLDPSGFSAAQGLRGGRNGVSEARADGLAVTARVEVEPTLGVVAGLSAYLSEAGPNADYFDSAGDAVELDVPVYGVSLDARGRHAGFEARAVLAWFAIGDSAELGRVADRDGTPLGVSVASELYGLYGEVAYDLLHAPLDTEQQLLPFVRVERYDTLADVTGREVIRAEEAYGVTEVVFGLTYRPISQVAFKTAFLWRDPDGPVPAQGRLDLGVGVMF
jgi:hypothetical protein